MGSIAFVMRPIRLAGVVLLLAACGDSSERERMDDLPAATATSKPPMNNPLQLNTYQGRLLGAWAEEAGQIRAFQGIPYARPPIGPLRWQPPQAPASWRGTRDALEPGPACWQAWYSEYFVWERGAFPRSEDCLYLNIWSVADAADQPVMVWFHGGGHTVGMAHEQIFDGTELARQGVVVVTVNYRLGPFGFLAHPALAAESSHNSAGNYGLLDKIAALNWVRDNIPQFGGNPDNVTIFGQSAGSQSVCSLMVSPLARGLFHKAIGQSASCVSPLPAEDSNGFMRGQRLVEELGTQQNTSAMRSATAEEVLAAAERSNWAQQPRIVIDGWVLPDDQDALYASAQQAKVPLLLGWLSNEGHQLFPASKEINQSELEAFAGKLAGAKLAPKLLDLYRAHAAVSPTLAQQEIKTDLFIAYGMRRWADHQIRADLPAYLYFMNHDTPAFRLYWPDNADLQLPAGPRSAGAYHSGDLAYVFGNTRKVGMGWNDDDHALAAMMVRYWTNFARHGDPNGEGLPQWQPYNAQNRHTLTLRPDAHTVSGVRSDVLNLWDERFRRD